jgi:hypothetical protein
MHTMEVILVVQPTQAIATKAFSYVSSYLSEACHMTGAIMLDPSRLLLVESRLQNPKIFV